MPDKNDLRILALCAAMGCAFLTSFLVGEANAEERKRPAPPFAAIGAGLGMSEEQVAGCFPKPDQTVNGESPRRSEMRAVIGCLMEQDASLTGEEIVRVLKDNKPDRGGKRG
ncbi:hypothetical protein BXY66_3108 [Shimia isoporae]|uniref:Uncharacterized protein n=1 Tax=Shimia isoporae TaxID=647720 RepID=A0A4R1NAN7_9RHOB|nr:hypothetical protein [Shimia isoporae]TCL00466.1 hypothetical protein BXY66_3108 [Shimia isoporae]